LQGGQGMQARATLPARFTTPTQTSIAAQNQGSCFSNGYFKGFYE